MPNTNYVAGGIFDTDFFGEKPVARIREKVICAGGAAFTPITQVMPPRCRVIWAGLRTIHALTETGTDATSGVASNATNTANALALIWQTATAPITTPTLGTVATSATNIILINNSTLSTQSAGSMVGGIGTSGVQVVNTSSNPGYFFLIPSVSPATNYTSQISTSGFQENVRTDTAGFKWFSTTTNATNATSNTAAVNVAIDLEYFGDPPTT